MRVRLQREVVVAHVVDIAGAILEENWEGVCAVVLGLSVVLGGRVEAHRSLNSPSRCWLAEGGGIRGWFAA